MSIYTKTGDSGDTSLFDGTRVSKTHPRVVAYGDVDEVQACLGVVRAAGLPRDLDEMCVALQRDLFALGADAVEPVVIVYLNRLSDLLFTMARAANHRAGVTETPW